MNLLILLITTLSERSNNGLFDVNATLPFIVFHICFLTLILNIIFFTPIEKIIEKRKCYVHKKLEETSSVLFNTNRIIMKCELQIFEERKKIDTMILHTQENARKTLNIEIKKIYGGSEMVLLESIHDLHLQKEKTLEVLKNHIHNMSDLIQNKVLNDSILSQNL